ncbi:MAG TPA: hypothetical protein VMD25_08000 [Acidobacteriaceae bacterium]|nr:hypothetical protein [Acidobacteriaceae bacterium]
MTPFIRRTRPCWILLLALACAPLPVRAQQADTPPSPRNQFPGIPNTPPTDTGDAHVMRDMAKERNMMRQKEIIDDTNRLLELARQLKTAVDKSNKDQLSLSVVDTANEIEKLAKTVKEKMRDGD